MTDEEVTRQNRQHQLSWVKWLLGIITTLVGLAVKVWEHPLIAIGVALLVLAWILRARLRCLITSRIMPLVRDNRWLWLRVFVVVSVMVAVTLWLEGSTRPLRCPPKSYRVIREMDQAIAKDLKSDGRNGQMTLHRLVLQRKGISGDRQLVANVLLRFGLIDYERGILPAEEVSNLIGLCRCVSPEYLWPFWTKLRRRTAERPVAKSRRPLSLPVDPNMILVFGGDQISAGRTLVASDLSTRFGTRTAQQPLTVHVIPWEIPSSSDVMFYIEVFRVLTGGTHFAWLSESGPTRFLAYDAEMQAFLVCAPPILQASPSGINWAKVESYLHEQRLMSLAWDELTEGDYYESSHILTSLGEEMAPDSVFGSQFCLLRGLLHILLYQKNAYYAMQAGIERWKGNAAFPFVDLISDIGGAFLAEESDEQELEQISRKLNQNRPLLSFEQAQISEALLVLLSARHCCGTNQGATLLRSLAKVPAEKAWQRSKYALMFDLLRKKQESRGEEASAYIKAALDIATPMKRNDVCLLAHWCALDIMRDGDDSKTYLNAMAALIQEGSPTYLVPLVTLRLFPRAFAVCRDALDTQTWKDLSEILVDATTTFIGSESKYGTCATKIRRLVGLSALKTQLGASGSDLVREMILGIDPGMPKDGAEIVPDLIQLLLLFWTDRAMLEELLPLYREWAEIRLNKAEQTFVDHANNVRIAEILTVLTVLAQDYQRALGYSDAALAHLAVARKGGFVESHLLDFILSEQSFVLSLVIGDQVVTDYRCRLAEEKMAKVLSDWWSKRDMEPELQQLGSEVIPSIARLLQRYVFEKLKPDSWGIQGTQYLTVREPLIRESAAECAMAIEHYFLSKCQSAGPMTSMRAENVHVVIAIMEEAYVGSMLPSPDRNIVGVRGVKMAQQLSETQPGCGLTHEHSGSAMRLFQLATRNIVLSYMDGCDPNLKEKAKRVLSTWTKEVASSIEFSELNSPPEFLRYIMGVAYKELHYRFDDAGSLQFAPGSDQYGWLLQVLAALPDTLDAVLDFLDFCFSGGIPQSELELRLLPGSLPEEAMAASLALQVRTMNNVVRRNIKAVDSNPESVASFLRIVAREWRDMLDVHADIFKHLSSSEQLNLIIVEQLVLSLMQERWDVAADQWAQFNISAFPPRSRSNAAILKALVSTHLLRRSGQLQPAFEAIEAIRASDPNRARLFLPVAALLGYEKGDLALASRYLREYFDKFTPDEDTIAHQWGSEISVLLGDANASFLVRLTVPANPLRNPIVAQPGMMIPGRRCTSGIALNPPLLGSPTQRKYDFPASNLSSSSPKDKIKFTAGSKEELGFVIPLGYRR